MGDVKDILGLGRDSTGADAALKEKKDKKELQQRPKGMSREAFNLLHGSHHIQQGDLLREYQQKEQQKAATFTKVCTFSLTTVPQLRAAICAQSGALVDDLEHKQHCALVRCTVLTTSTRNFACATMLMSNWHIHIAAHPEKGATVRKAHSVQTTFQLLPFANEARKDGLQLRHWTPCFKDATGQTRPVDDGPYTYAKFDVACGAVKFNALEYDNAIRPKLPPQETGWSKVHWLASLYM